MKKIIIPIMLLVACNNNSPSKDAKLIKEEIEIRKQLDEYFKQKDSISNIYDSLYNV